MRVPDETPKTGQVSVVVPFFNEENFIGRTLESLNAQRSAPRELILVDNGSTDSSVKICESFRDGPARFPVCIVSEPRPGKVFALEAGLERVSAPYIAFCDADAYYPPHYLELALHLLETSKAAPVGAMALGLTANAHSLKGRLQRWKGALVGALLARQCHTGGFGQIFRTNALRRVGGYSMALWPYMQADHEIVHRVLKLGPCRYHRDLWCRPSTRRAKNRARVSWSFFEIVVYHLTPFYLKDWYFYDFLQKRFARRGMMNVNLREQPWTEGAQSQRHSPGYR